MERCKRRMIRIFEQGPDAVHDEDCPPFVAMPHDMHERVRGYLWDTRRMDEGIVMLLDDEPELPTHLDLVALKRHTQRDADRRTCSFSQLGMSWEVEDDPSNFVTVLHPPLLSYQQAVSAISKDFHKMQEKGWYEFFGHLPSIPYQALPQGSTSRKLEPERPRRTSDGSAPHDELRCSSGCCVIVSLNELTRAHCWSLPDGKMCVRRGRVPPVVGAKRLWPHESKPSLVDAMKAVAVLLWLARLTGIALLTFGDDFKTYFSQFWLRNSSKWRSGSLFLVKDSKGCWKLTFVWENVMGFGVAPASNHGQHQGSQLLRVFDDIMDKAVLTLPSLGPVVDRWLAVRRAKLGALHARLWVSFIYSDDPCFWTLSPPVTVLAVRVWTTLTRGVKFLMAIPEKRFGGAASEWLGATTFTQLGLLAVPLEKRFRA